MDMLIETLSTADPCALLLAGSMMAGMVITAVIFTFAQYLLTAAGYSRMFRKAGIPGWKAFIPFYNDFTKYQLVWSGRQYLLYLAAFWGSSILSATGNSALNIVAVALITVALVMAVKQHLKMAKAFGKGNGIGLLLMLFPFVMAPVLGYGKAEYQDN